MIGIVYKNFIPMVITFNDEDVDKIVEYMVNSIEYSNKGYALFGEFSVPEQEEIE
jgi:hypothetical protein